ncbi:MAG: hypothetical protein PHO01_05840 [Desulfotomaculaceae bacterium]|nr:hypothetical protein [Desulfotomaculaceae bacterium]
MTGSKKSCPCGSGKPFDECCGQVKAYYSLEQARWRRAGQTLRRKLGEFADQPSFAWDAARAQDMYLDCMDQQLMLQDDDFTMERCFEWFIFDFYLSSTGTTVLETFAEEYAFPLNKYERALVKNWVRSRLSIYEVMKVFPKEGLQIKDLLTQKNLRVRDQSAATELKEGSILLMRVLKVGEEYEFSTSGLALPSWCKSPLLKRLGQDRLDYYNEKLKGGRGWGPYLKERAHIINAWVMEYGTSGALHNHFSIGEEKGNKVIFNNENGQEVLAIIKQSEDFALLSEIKDNTGNLLQAEAAWLGPGHDRSGAGCGDKSRLRLVRGRLLLTPVSIIMVVRSSRQLQAAKKLFVERFMGPSEAGREESPGRPALPEVAAKDYQWPEPGYARVATYVQEGLHALGYNDRQQQGALSLWFDYCTKERPAIRKEAVWSAAVVYTFARLEMAEGLKQQDLAWRYGVASSTISSKFRLICRSLELALFDQRYSTKPPLADKGKNKSLL